MQSTTRRRWRLSVRSTRRKSISGASCSIILMPSFLRCAHMLIQRALSSRETFLSASAVPALTPGSIRSSSIWIHRQEHRLMHSLLMVRTGDSLPTTGRRWLRTISHGGSHVLPRCLSISMYSVSTTSSVSSVSGRFLSGQRAV